LPIQDRVGLCRDLMPLVTGEHVPALDEFADGIAPREFRLTWALGKRLSDAASLFIPAVCSRVQGGDFSGLARFSEMIAATPAGKADDWRRWRPWIARVRGELILFAARHDGLLSEPARQAIVAHAEVLATSDETPVRSGASLLLHIAAADPAALAASLERCGLEDVEPALVSAVQSPWSTKVSQAMLKLALVHPVSSDALMELVNDNSGQMGRFEVILPILEEPKLRAKLPPEMFFKHLRQLSRAGPREIDAVKHYAEERAGEFNPEQAEQIEQRLESLENQPPVRERHPVGPRRRRSD
jgi:hypothetical protein